MELFSSYTGTDFLVFYSFMLLTAVAAGLWIPANLRPEGKVGAVRGMEEVAVLAGGFTRHALAVSSDLMARDALTVGGKHKLRVGNADVETGVAGRSILSEIGDLKLAHLAKATKPEAQRVEADLIERGLMMDQSERLNLRVFSVAPYIALLVIGLYRYAAGNAEGEPTQFLLMFMLVTVVFAAIRFFRTNRRTKAGNAVIMDLEEQSSRLKRAPRASEAGFAVALFGTAVLVGTPWEAVHAMRQAGGGDGGSYGGDGGDGGGGGCGGGCGGCGG